MLVGTPTSAQLSTAASLSGEAPLSSSDALEFVDLETALGLTTGTLPGDTFEGSGLALAFTTTTASTLSFSWTLDTVDFDTVGGSQADRAFVVLDGAVLVPLGTVAAGTVGGSFSHTFAANTSHALAVLVMDVDAYDRVSTLAISNLSVSAVPEPGSLALLLAGVAGLAAWGHTHPSRRRRTDPGQGTQGAAQAW